MEPEYIHPYEYTKQSFYNSEEEIPSKPIEPKIISTITLRSESFLIPQSTWKRTKWKNVKVISCNLHIIIGWRFYFYK